jgi:hypothetical protein
MSHDPVLDKLAKFTPDRGIVDHAELLFAAGQASARTHWLWKAAVAALLAANVACVALLILDRSSPASQPPPAVVPSTPPSTPPADYAIPDPWSYQTLREADLADFPKLARIAGDIETPEPLTVLSGRRGQID